MTNQQHPITPPPELIAKWAGSMCGYYEAARWGADEELEACKQWLTLRNYAGLAIELGLCMRNKPKPPSLKEKALAVIENFAICDHLTPNNEAILRQALEALPND